MADITEIVGAAISDATDDAGESPDTDTSTDDSSEPSSAASGSEAVSPSSASDEAVSLSSATADAAMARDKDLEALGLKPNAEGQRENRIKQSRVVKMIAKAREKLAAEHATAVKERDDRIAAAEARWQEQERINRLADQDPARFMETLAAINPKFKPFLQRQAAQPQPQAPAATTTDPMPQPDGRYADGSVGYTPEGLKKYQDWQNRQVKAEVKEELRKEYEERFGPIERDYRAQQLIEQQKPLVLSKLESARQTWGQLFDEDYNLKDQSEILKTMQANDGQNGRPFLSFEAAVAKVLVPKARAQRETMRADLLKEINQRPAGAQRSTPGVATNGSNGTGTRSVEDIVGAAIRAHK